MSRNDTGDRIMAKHGEAEERENQGAATDRAEGGSPARGGQPGPPAEFTGETGTRPGSSSSIGRGGDAVVHSTREAADMNRPVDRGSRTQGGPDVEPVETGRTAIDMAPGLPAGGHDDLQSALESEDRELGGAVAADTTPAGPTEDRPSPEQVKREDKGRNTL